VGIPLRFGPRPDQLPPLLPVLPAVIACNEELQDLQDLGEGQLLGKKLRVVLSRQVLAIFDMA